ncbi:MAG TPA: chloride channel protein [Polyangia bacterium]|nr:chloride channel protein [Polyangia bacterium]
MDERPRRFLRVPIGGRILASLIPESAPLDMRIVGRTLLHAALVGVGAGLIGAAFFAGLEYMQFFVLEALAGYQPLRASGERIIHGSGADARVFRPWLLLFLPALGALAGGLLTRLAPETAGGGGDAMIEAFHHHGGAIRKRVLWVKGLASIFTLGFGGAGGREGPTMQIGGALGSLVSRVLRVDPRERRVLMVAGVAAGMSAVFRTPLGAALLAVEVLYRDDFETEALVPAVLASVVAYSVVISIFGESTLFAHAPRYPFVPMHLPLYILLALFEALLAATFVATLRRVQSMSGNLPLPIWARPALGGLLLGAVSVPAIMVIGSRIGIPGQGLGILGGGYGAVQTAITGADWLKGTWGDVELLLLLCVAKLIGASLTIGSGGSAGDFAPSLVLGGLFGGAFGRAAQLLLPGAHIDAGAFALVGMGTFYGGIAHVPLSALVFVCELAGSYDLLVPLMLAEGVAFVALRKQSLYTAQVPTREQSPLHAAKSPADVLKTLKVAAAMVARTEFITFRPAAPIAEVVEGVSASAWQDAFPVIDEAGKLHGMISAEVLRVLAGEKDLGAVAIAADVMQAPITARDDDDLRTAAERMLQHSLRELAVVDATGRIVGFLDEADIAKAYLAGNLGADQRAP